MKICQRCNATCRGWFGRVDGVWRLANLDGTLHECAREAEVQNEYVNVTLKKSEAPIFLHAIAEQLPHMVAGSNNHKLLLKVKAMLEPSEEEDEPSNATNARPRCTTPPSTAAPGSTARRPAFGSAQHVEELGSNDSLDEFIRFVR